MKKLSDLKQYKIVVGVDEVGRGPLAGPVAIGVCAIPFSKIIHLKEIGFFNGVKDSKKLSDKKREEWLSKIKFFKSEGYLDYCVSFASNKMIDKFGIVYSIKSALKDALKKIKINPENSIILLDGGLKAPKEFKNQKTIIKGDEKEPIISLASIAAKVARDKKMIKYSKKFPRYGFEIHKGYGTLLHRQNIKKYGLSELHRKSFCGIL